MGWRITGKRRLVIAIVILLAASQVLADTEWTSGHHEILNGQTYVEIWMYNESTLDIRGGNIYRLAAYDDTVTNWYVGQMGVLWANGNSIINIYGGTLLNELASADSSLVNLYAYDVTIDYTGGRWEDGQIAGKYYIDNSSFVFDLWGQDTYSHINIIPEPTTLLLLGFGGILMRIKK